VTLPQIPLLHLKGPTSKAREGEGGLVRRRGEGFCLYLSIRGLRKGPGKFFMGVVESPEFFVSKRVKTLLSLSKNYESVTSDLPLEIW